MDVRFDNSYARLPERFYTRMAPDPVREPATLRVNAELAGRLGFDPQWLESGEGAEFATGNRVLSDSEPVAMVYAGHQFGNWVPRLGDGRAILLGEVLTDDGARFDIHLKGSGRTPYSRRGDGRSPLGPVLREYGVSEAMAALGIPTTRALVAASTGEKVRREKLLPGAVLVRVARSHIRIGTFQYFAARDDDEALQILYDHVVERHYPDLQPDSPAEFLRAVAARQAKLVAQWQLVGFIHGVMNTDNMLLSGETIDYGPCAFMNEYDPETVYSSIDRMGRYAYGNQPPIAQWNLARLGEVLLRLTDDSVTVVNEVRDVIDGFPEVFRREYGAGMARKLGFVDFDDVDWPLVEDLLALMYEHKLDYTLTFRRLTELAADASEPDGEGSLSFPDELSPWLDRWRERLADDGRERMARNNPVVIPRNHVVNAAIEQAVEHGDYSEFHALVDAVTSPYAPGKPDFSRPPSPDQRIHATFCGT